MKTFKIAHLYYDLLNLYGENGNILALKHHLEKHNLKVTVDYLSIEDTIDFAKYDFFYMGSGNDEAISLCMNHLLKYQSDITNAIANHKFFLITGNALVLFGKTYKNLPALNIFDYLSEEIDFRIVGEQFYKMPLLNQPIIGFTNRNCILRLVKENYLFEVKKGTGYVPKAIVEGIWKNNFYGTFLLGPLLIRNPHFTEYLVEQIMNMLGLKYSYYHDYWGEKAYENSKK